ncbi:MAG: Wzz/FepE/Etk N-terminal domain-containing protein [Bacteroidia bacterium]
MYTQDFLAFLRFLFQHKYKFLIASALGAAMALGYALFLPKKYTSIAVIYPTGGNDSEKSMQFGLDLHSDQIMQILISNAMRDSLVKTFHLTDYYGIDKQQPDWEATLDKKYRADVSFSKTRYLSMQIQVSTQKTELSAQMANKIIDYTTLIYNGVLGQSTQKLKENALQTLAIQEANMQRLADSLRYMFRTKGDSIQIRFIRQAMNDVQKQVSVAREDVAYFTNRNAHPNPAMLVLDRAKPNYRKSTPSYSQFLLLGGFLGGLAMLSFFLAKQIFSAIKERT